MEIEYTYRFEDYYEISKARRASRRFAPLRNTFIFALIVVNLGLGLFMIYTTLSNDAPMGVLTFLNLGIGLVLALYFILGDRLIHKWYLRQHNIVGKQVRINLHPEKIKVTAGANQTETKLSGLLQLQETDTHFLLWLNKVQAYSIPKNALNGQADLSAFREPIEQACGQQFQKLGKHS